MKRNAVDTISRKDLLKALDTAKAAVGRAAFVPVLGHFCITGDKVVAYDDTIAISVDIKLPVQCAVPADLFLKLLNSLSAEAMTLDQDGGAVVVTCGKSRLKVPSLPPETFIFKEKFGREIAHFNVKAEFLEGLAACLVSVGNDPTHPSQLGVTLEASDEGATLYSTDNVTMSRYKLAMGPGELRVIMPTEFCKQLVALAKADDDTATLTVHDACVVARLRGETVLLYSKTISAEKPLDFAGVFGKMMSGKAKASDIPPSWDPAFTRAAAVVNPTHPVAKVQVDDEVVSVTTTSQLGETHDEFAAEGAKDSPPFLIDPTHVLRVSKLCDTFTFYGSCVVMAKGSFTHLVSHCEE